VKTPFITETEKISIQDYFLFDSMIGKSSTLNHVSFKKFNKKYIKFTIFIDFHVIDTQVVKKFSYKYETQEVNKNSNQSFFNIAEMFKEFFVYNITNIDYFKNILMWMK
jgi:hypothetical protein